MADPTQKPRWFHPTPDHFVIVFLAVVCLLWLLEGFHWFPFSHGKGWTVLIAVAVVVATILPMLLWLIASLLFRRRFQFSIRSLLLLTIAVAIPFSWLAVELRTAKRQQEAAAAIDKLGGKVDWSKELSGPGWLQRLLGDDFFETIVAVNLDNRAQVTDADLETLKGLNRLQRLSLWRTPITDAGLRHLKGLSQLHDLILNDTKITDAGLEYLKAMSQLQQLALCSTQVTDAGLKCIEGLTQLRQLGLASTQIGDVGLVHLKGLNQLQKIGLGWTRITDAGLVHLKGLNQLQELAFHSTRITDAGLEHLAGLSQLQQLALNGTETTHAGVAKLQQALPKCQIFPAECYPR